MIGRAYCLSAGPRAAAERRAQQEVGVRMSNLVEYTKWRQVLSTACRSLNLIRAFTGPAVVSESHHRPGSFALHSPTPPEGSPTRTAVAAALHNGRRPSVSGLAQLVGVLFCLVGAPLRAAEPPAQAPSIPPFYLIRRAIVLPNTATTAPDVPVQALIDRQRALQARRRRRRIRLTAPAPAPARPRSYAQIGQKSARQQPDPDRVPVGERTALATALFRDALTERLGDTLRVTVISDDEVRAALRDLHLTTAQATRPTDARRLCVQLRCQALFAPAALQVTIHEGMAREVTVRTVVAATYADLGLAEAAGTHGVNGPLPQQGQSHQSRMGGRPTASTAIGAASVAETALPETLPVAGAVRIDHPMFRRAYLQTQAAAIRIAARQAALAVIGMLRTGQGAPFAPPGVRIAIAPVPSPGIADKLVFTVQGRHVEIAALRGLPEDVATLFTPDLEPLDSGAIVGPDRVTAALQAAHISAAALWAREDTPAIEPTRALGRRLKVDYVLLAHVTDVGLEEGPATTETVATETGVAGSRLEQEAYAESEGALVRVADGAVLWHNRAGATMNAQAVSDDAVKSAHTARRAVHDAIHFSLVDLARRLTHYLDSFSQ